MAAKQKPDWFCCYVYTRGAQPFSAKGRNVLFSVHSRAEDKMLCASIKAELSRA